MPLFEYKCNVCKTEWEDLLPYEKIPKCPNCSSIDTEKMISSGMFPIFKGNGFYETEYKRPKTTTIPTKKK